MIDLQDDTKDLHSATATGPAANGLEESKLVMIQEHGISSMPRVVRSGAEELRSLATLSYDSM